MNENLVNSHAVTAAVWPCASDVCAQKTIYQKFKLIWFKTHDFSVINMIIRTKADVFSRYDLKCAALFWKGGGSSSSFGFKETGTEISVSASTQNRHFQNDIINDLWGILS